MSSQAPDPLRVWTCPTMQPNGGNSLAVSGLAIFQWLRLVDGPSLPINFVAIFLAATSVGLGAQTAEIGLCSGTGPPSAVNMTFTKLVATGTMGSLTANTVVVTNTASFAFTPTVGTYLYAMCRFAMATTQPTTAVGTPLTTFGELQSISGSGVLTGAGPFVATIPTLSTVNCPIMRARLY